ncbi:MAG: T9SS type A sorting domain-containing protein, partial [Candidatus Cloacimonetes bacterium]|nr:T9SS type A sorting domain-containing protein [Candidatus Cloacimonadota bacterium]
TNQGRIFVGSDSGIFDSANGGDSWISISNGIPNVPITDIKIHNNTRILVIGTYGCSAYKIDLDTDFVAAETEQIDVSNQIQNYPNPFSSSTTISFQLSTKNSNDVKLEIYNLKGQKVKTLECINSFDAQATQSLYSITWNGTDDNNKPVSSGTYLYKLKADGRTLAVKKCILIR